MTSAKVFMTGRSQAVRLPKAYRFNVDEVLIEQQPDGALLLQSSPGDPLGVWREGGGRLRFEALELTWGPLLTTGTVPGSAPAPQTPPSRAPSRPTARRAG